MAGIVAAGGLGVATRRTRRYLTDRMIPMAALVASFVFAAQMVNFPVVPGMSGHLIGAVLAAVLVGPAAGVLVMTIVLAVQGLVFADGGLSALGLNIVNLALVAGVGGYLAYRALRFFVGGAPQRVALLAGIAAFLSVPMAAAAFAVEFAVGGTAASVSVTAVLWAMLTTHTLIGIGEGVITAFVIVAVVRSRPDLVHGLAGGGRLVEDRVR